MARKALGKRLRFEIFKRDGFRCIYCGATPQNMPLHIDHVEPVASGGTNDPSNLVTACGACNGGKSAVRLTESRFSPRSIEETKDHRDQILGYLEAEREVIKARDALVIEIRKTWEKLVDAKGNTQREISYFARVSQEFAFSDITHAILLTCNKFRGVNESFADRRQFRYFCGILRSWRQEGVK